MIRDLQHLLFTTVSNVLYSLGHVLAAPHCPPCWGKYCPPCRQVGGRSAFEPEGAGGPGRGRAIQAGLPMNPKTPTTSAGRSVGDLHMVDLHLPLSRAKAATTAGNKEIQLYIMFGGWVEAKKMFFKAPTKS